VEAQGNFVFLLPMPRHQTTSESVEPASQAQQGTRSKNVNRAGLFLDRGLQPGSQEAEIAI
jgi:hypothetical protein